MTAFTVVADGLAFPESPRWHDGRIWLVEKRGGRVLAGPAGATGFGPLSVVVEVPDGPGGIGWDPQGRLLVVGSTSRCLYRLDGDALTTVADLSAFTVGRANDMVVDGRGRAYVGHFGYDLLGGGAPAPGRLVLVDPTVGGVSVRPVGGPLEFANGAVIDPSGETLIVAESAACRLSAFSIDADGSLGDRRVFAELGSTVPDGIALDAEGGVWIADPVNCELVRVLDGGAVTDRIDTDGRGAFACALGGPSGTTLFVCLYDEQASRSTAGAAIGSLVTTEVAIPAAAAPKPREG
jgi:sugar lactone lactonase YvrE